MTDKSPENAKSSSQPKVDNSPTCGNCDNYVPYQHRPTGQRKPRFYFRPISYAGTLTHKSSRIWRRFLSAKATKRRERRKAIKQMTYKINRKMNSKEKIDTCRTCGKCKHFTTYRPAWHNGGYGLCKLNKVINCTDHSCEHHEPADK